VNHALVPPYGPPLIIIGVYRPPNRDTFCAERLCHEMMSSTVTPTRSFVVLVILMYQTLTGKMNL